MTICVAVKVIDGMVLATDSMSVLYSGDERGKAHPIKHYSNSVKLFQINDLPMGVMTYGAAGIGEWSKMALFDQFKTDEVCVGSVAQDLFVHVADRYWKRWDGDHGKKNPPSMGFFIAGFSEGSWIPEEYEFCLPISRMARTVKRENGRFGPEWRGIQRHFGRCFSGVDDRALRMLAQLKPRPKTAKRIKKAAIKLRAPIEFSYMPIMEAVDFARFAIDVTVKMEHFSLGPPACGGPLQMAVIMRKSGFCWIERLPQYIENHR